MAAHRTAVGQEPNSQAWFRMKIGGMSCSFCTSTIRRAYERMDGVSEVGVSLADEEGLVKYDPQWIGADELRRTLEQLGYTYRDPDKVRSFEEENRELALSRGRLLVAAGFSLVALVAMVFGMEPFLTWIAHPFLVWVLAALALNTMFVSGWFIKPMAWHSLRRGILNQHVLLEFGAFAGLLGGFLGIFVDPGFLAGHFFAVAVFITTYHLLSGYASKVVRTRSSQAIRRLMDLQPDTARVLRDGEEVEVAVAEVGVGEWVRVRPGESVAVDGTVVERASVVDESLVTGESMPAEKATGDVVIGGSINQTGTLLIEASRVGEESFLSQVARSIEQARALRPGVLQLLDVVLKYYVPGVLAFAAAAFVGWTLVPALFGEVPDWFRATFALLAVLVLGYPCALGMAAPLAMIRGGGEAARQGILMRSGEAFEIMDKIRTVVLDKTGTLTRGEPAVAEVVAAGTAGEDEALRLAASVESASEHPLARAIEDAAEERGLGVTRAGDFTSHTGKGVEATVDGRRVLVGKPAFLAEQGIAVAVADPARERLEHQGVTVVGVARDRQLLGLIGVGDAVKPDAAQTVHRLKAAGITSVMITGDNARTAEAVAARVGIDRVLAGVLPDDKAGEIRRLQQEGQRVVMVGDGINDAPALTQADVGMAIGAGTDIAIEAADIVLMSERLSAVADAREVAMRSYAKTKQNLAIAFAFNGVGVPAATTGLVHPIWAMAAMLASVSLVLANSFGGRLLRRARGEPLARPEEQLRHQHERGGLTPTASGDRGHPTHPVPSAGHAEAATHEATTAVVRLGVPMHCRDCAERIEQRLGGMEAVRTVAADHRSDTVTLTHTAGAAEGEARAALHQMGFDVTGHAGDTSEVR